jgi:hypothetical protein
MAAVQEMENLGKAPATSVMMIYAIKRPVGYNGRLIKVLSRFLSGFPGRLVRTSQTASGVSGGSA